MPGLTTLLELPLLPTFFDYQLHLPLSKRNRLIIGGHSVRPGSLRLQVFRRDGFKCVECGKQGNIIKIQYHKSNQIVPHINMYHVDKSGGHILMTKDHIIPVSKGGQDTMKNLQTMCFPCNKKKGNTYTEGKYKCFEPEFFSC